MDGTKKANELPGKVFEEPGQMRHESAPAFFIASLICIHSIVAYSSEASRSRLEAISSHLDKSRVGIRMLLRYTEAPDQSQKMGAISGGFLIPSTNRLVEVLVKDDLFQMDETLEDQVVSLPGGKLATNFGWMIGRYPSGGENGEPISRTSYYWSPQKQYSFTTRTNGFASPGGWVDNLFASKQKVANNLLRFFLPDFDLRALQISDNGILLKTSGGPLVINILTNSASVLEIEFALNAAMDFKRLIRLGYEKTSDLTPKTIDCFIVITNPPQRIHEITAKILQVEYLSNTPPNLPEKVLSDIETPGFRGIFEVSSTGQIQIVGTNKIPVSNARPPNIEDKKDKRLFVLALALVFVTTNAGLLWLLISSKKQKHLNKI